MNRCCLTVMLIGTFALGGVNVLAQTSSLGAKHRKAEEENPKPTSREDKKEKINPTLEKHSWIAKAPTPPKTYKPGDLLTIIVRERSKFEVESDLTTKKAFGVKSELEAFLNPVSGGIGASQFRRGKPNIDYKFDANLKTEGDTAREDRFTTRITGEIIDVKPNGVLVFWARGQVIYDDETSSIKIAGSCRKEDVTADNTILSTQVADKVVTVENAGAMRRANTRGWIPKLLDLLKPI